MDVLTSLTVWVLLGTATGTIAWNRGHSFFAWWFFGLLLFPLALPLAFTLGRNIQVLDARTVAEGAWRRCPHCYELIRLQASVCQYCTRDLPPVDQPQTSLADIEEVPPDPRFLTCTIICERQPGDGKDIMWRLAARMDIAVDGDRQVILRSKPFRSKVMKYGEMEVPRANDLFSNPIDVCNGFIFELRRHGWVIARHPSNGEPWFADHLQQTR